MQAIIINQIDIVNDIIDKIYIFAEEYRNKTICVIIPDNCKWYNSKFKSPFILPMTASLNSDYIQCQYLCLIKDQLWEKLNLFSHWC